MQSCRCRGQDIGRASYQSWPYKDNVRLVSPEGEGLHAGDEHRVLLCKTHSLKGTEFRAVNLVNMEGMTKLGAAQKRISYTALTRAKTVLAIYWKGKLPPHLQAACAAFEEGEKKVDLEGLFAGEGDE